MRSWAARPTRQTQHLCPSPSPRPPTPSFYTARTQPAPRSPRAPPSLSRPGEAAPRASPRRFHGGPNSPQSRLSGRACGPMANPAVEAALQSALANQQYDSVAPILDAAELESSNPDILNEWPHALHILGLIYNQQLEDARFLWKRMPMAVKRDNPELDAVWRLLQYFWNKHYQGIWQALQGYQWSPQVRPFIDALVAKTRSEMLQLLSEGYSLVSPAKAASLLGVPEGEVAHVVEAAGWKQDMESGCYATALQAAPDAELDGYENLQQLAQYMVHLES